MNPTSWVCQMLCISNYQKSTATTSLESEWCLVNEMQIPHEWGSDTGNRLGQLNPASLFPLAARLVLFLVLINFFHLNGAANGEALYSVGTLFWQGSCVFTAWTECIHWEKPFHCNITRPWNEAPVAISSSFLSKKHLKTYEIFQKKRWQL